MIKKAEEKLSVRVVDKKTGVGQDAEIEIYDFSTGQKVNSGRASASGIYEFGFAKNDYSELVVVSKSAGDFTFYKVSFYPVPEVERVVYIYADSPLYKPGLVVDIKGYHSRLQKFNLHASRNSEGDGVDTRPARE